MKPHDLKPNPIRVRGPQLPQIKLSSGAPEKNRKQMPVSLAAKPLPQSIAACILQYKGLTRVSGMAQTPSPSQAHVAISPHLPRTVPVYICVLPFTLKGASIWTKKKETSYFWLPRQFSFSLSPFSFLSNTFFLRSRSLCFLRVFLTSSLYIFLAQFLFVMSMKLSDFSFFPLFYYVQISNRFMHRFNIYNLQM